jgi:hypothetical protein
MFNEYFLELHPHCIHSKSYQCCHIISSSCICKQINHFHSEINFQPKNVKHKSLVTLRMALINLFTPRCEYKIDLALKLTSLKFIWI